MGRGQESPEDLLKFGFGGRLYLFGATCFATVVTSALDQVYAAFIANLAVTFRNINDMSITVAFLALHHGGHPVAIQVRLNRIV